ncbi:MAG: SNF2-related protein, partial [Rubripirellula sp.]|nr:SNF2-related protein [Rubripirellula sp.]
MMKKHGSLEVQIDQANSWCEDVLVPAGTHELVLEDLTPRAFPIRVPVLKTKCVGFQFPQSGSWTSLKETKKEPTSLAAESKKISTLRDQPSGESGKAAKLRRHRIKPPNEVVKLQDRLFYLLQPPLDSLVGSGQMKFPFEPFPYQLDGIAFLFPRYAAILADEMGLGKTMQAISTIRMLICSGEAQSVLLVCPKPLVSNWIREFQVWAPEIPITTIG